MRHVTESPAEDGNAQPIVSLVPGTFRSIRAFEVRPFGLGPLAVGRMNTVYKIHAVPGSPYATGQTWHTAQCQANPSLWTAPPLHLTQIDADCRCGFYSFYDLQSLLFLCEEFLTCHVPALSRLVIGVVENAGQVLHHEDGLRSERMRIEAICPVTLFTRRTSFLYPIDEDQNHWSYWVHSPSWERRDLMTALTGMLDKFPLSPRPEFEGQA